MCLGAAKVKMAQSERGRNNKKLCSPFGKAHEMKSIQSTHRHSMILPDTDRYTDIYRWHTKSTFIVIIVSGNCHHKYLIVASIKAYDT